MATSYIDLAVPMAPSEKHEKKKNEKKVGGPVNSKMA
jgi:hypothetical protein